MLDFETHVNTKFHECLQCVVNAYACSIHTKKRYGKLLCVYIEIQEGMRDLWDWRRSLNQIYHDQKSNLPNRNWLRLNWFITLTLSSVVDLLNGYACLSICWSECLSLCLSVCLLVFVFVFLSVCLYIIISVSIYLFLTVCHSFLSLSIYLSIYLFFALFF